MWYICVITSTDWYTLYDGVEIVKARSVAEAGEKAKAQYIKKTGSDGFGSFRSVETIILCGDKKPKEQS